MYSTCCLLAVSSHPTNTHKHRRCHQRNQCHWCPVPLAVAPLIKRPWYVHSKPPTKQGRIKFHACVCVCVCVFECELSLLGLTWVAVVALSLLPPPALLGCKGKACAHLSTHHHKLGKTWHIPELQTTGGCVGGWKVPQWKMACLGCGMGRGSSWFFFFFECPC